MDYITKLYNFFTKHVTNYKLVILSILISLGAAMFEALTVALIIPLLESINGQGSSKLGYPFSLISNYFDGISTIGRVQLVAILLVIFTVIKNYLIYLSGIISGKMQISVINKVRLDCYKQILTVNISYIHSKKDSDLFTIIADHTRWSAQIISQIIPLFPQIFSAFILVVMLVAISWKLTLFALFMVILSSILMKDIIKKSEDTGLLSNLRYMEMNQILLSTISGMKVVRGFNKQKLMESKFKLKIQEEAKAIYENIKAITSVTPLYRTINIVTFGIILFGSTLVLNISNTSSLEGLVIFLFVLQRMIVPMADINQSRASIAKLIPYIDSLNNFLNTKNKPYLKNGANQIEKIEKNIIFNDVSFAYPESNNNVISKLNLEIQSGTKIAIIGPSGGGKSTIIDLLFRFYDPNNGTISIDGLSLQDFDIISWRNKIAVVSQDIFLFNDTIAANIAFGKIDATIKEIQNAAKLASASDFIEQFDNKYDTIVGDRGIRLSGGEKQRISIARAIITNPDLLIFDEATSSLDSHSEKLVQDTIESVSKGRTIITIAHRLSTIFNYDKIYVLSKGQIIEYGTHQELIDMNGLYSDLVNLQSNHAV